MQRSPKSIALFLLFSWRLRKKKRNFATTIMEQQEVKQVPYGVSDFVSVMEQNLYYVDKTMYLPELEAQPCNLFFIRPRRFGKSIFLSMLHSYYDCKQKEKFQKLFGSLWIGKHPTPLQGRYQVLHLDFSQVGGTNNFTNTVLNEKGESIYHAMTHAEEGQITCRLFESFPAYKVTDPDVFPSLLFYYGMLTIKGTRGAKLILGIPNNNVRKQYYNYLQELFEEKAYVDTELLTDYYYDMAYDGKWEEGLQFMADAYSKVSSIRDSIEAERNLQGFFMAYLNLNPYYYTAPELELNHGYCDFFLLPDLTHYASKHSYILELKVLSKKEFDEELKGAKHKDGSPMTKAEKQWEEAVKQIKRYAAAPRVEALRQGTTLHKIIMQFKGGELARMKEV